MTDLDRNAPTQDVPVNPETGKPYINTLAAVAISPAGGSPEKSPEVAKVVDVIRRSGLPSETNRVLAEQGMRTDVVMRLDIRPGFTGQIKAKQALVNEILGQEQ